MVHYKRLLVITQKAYKITVLIIRLNSFPFGTINDVIVLDRKIHKNYIDVDLILKTNNVNIFVFSADHTSFEIFELDIIGKKGRIEIKKSGSQINFYNVKKSENYKNYKVLELVSQKNNVLD